MLEFVESADDEERHRRNSSIGKDLLDNENEEAKSRFNPTTTAIVNVTPESTTAVVAGDEKLLVVDKDR